MAEGALELAPTAMEVPIAAQDPFTELEGRRQQTLRQYWITVVSVIGIGIIACTPFSLIYAWMTDSLAASHSGTLTQWLNTSLDAYGAWIPLVMIGWLATMLLISYLLLSRFAWSPKARFLSDAKQLINNTICTQQFPGIEFENSERISEERFNATALYANPAEDYRTSATFQGRWHAMRVCLSRFEATHSSRASTKKSDKRDQPDAEAGIVFVAEYASAMQCAARLLPPNEKFKSVRGEQKVEIRDQTTLHFFHARSNDPLRFHDQFDPKLLSVLGAVAKRFPGVRLRFKQNEFWIVFSGPWDLPEPSLYQRIPMNPQAPQFSHAMQTCLQAAEVIRKASSLWS
ncbi:MAG: hypothetical protein ACR2PZ_11660 [Pseudomonadales bacterium]